MLEPDSTARLFGWLIAAVIFAPVVLLGLIAFTWSEEEVSPCAGNACSISPSSC